MLALDVDADRLSMARENKGDFAAEASKRFPFCVTTKLPSGPSAALSPLPSDTLREETTMPSSHDATAAIATRAMASNQTARGFGPPKIAHK
jgi:hypothetical protein